MAGPIRARWGPSGRRSAHWPAALAGAVLVHGLIAAATLVPLSAPRLLEVPAEATVDMVFVEAATPVVVAEPATLPAEPTAPQAAVEAGAEPPALATAEPTVPPDEPTPPPVAAAQAEATAPAEEKAPAEPRVRAEVLPEPPPPPVVASPNPHSSPLAPMPKRMVATKIEAPRRAAETPPPSDAAARNSTSLPITPQPTAETITAWQATLAAWLTAHRVYPETARRRGVQGNVTVQFKVDRAGRVNDVSVLHGSGSAILDAAAQALLADATVPPPPPAWKQAIEIQIRYALKD